jgi:hypothetical protein
MKIKIKQNISRKREGRIFWTLALLTSLFSIDSVGLTFCVCSVHAVVQGGESVSRMRLYRDKCTSSACARAICSRLICSRLICSRLICSRLVLHEREKCTTRPEVTRSTNTLPCLLVFAWIAWACLRAARTVLRRGCRWRRTCARRPLRPHAPCRRTMARSSSPSPGCTSLKKIVSRVFLQSSKVVLTMRPS